MFNEQRIRAVLFYASLVVFFVGLPFILSFALGYKFDNRTFKFTKTGIISIRTQPGGASVYLDNKLLNEKTPVSIDELLPGEYNIKIDMDGHYSWQSRVFVEAGKITRLEKIILFLTMPNIKHLNIESFSAFWIEEEKGAIYYVNNEDETVYSSDLEGEHFDRVAPFIKITPAPLKWRLSPDGQKILYFNLHNFGICFSEFYNKQFNSQLPFVLNFNDRIIDIFWHSDSYHLIIVSQKAISVIEMSPQAIPVELVRLNKRNTKAFYVALQDAVYYLDSQVAEDGNAYDNLYKLELGAKVFNIQNLIKIKPHEYQQEQ